MDRHRDLLQIEQQWPEYLLLIVAVGIQLVEVVDNLVVVVADSQLVVVAGILLVVVAGILLVVVAGKLVAQSMGTLGLLVELGPELVDSQSFLFFIF